MRGSGTLLDPYVIEEREGFLALPGGSDGLDMNAYVGDLPIPPEWNLAGEAYLRFTPIVEDVTGTWEYVTCWNGILEAIDLTIDENGNPFIISKTEAQPKPKLTRDDSESIHTFVKPGAGLLYKVSNHGPPPQGYCRRALIAWKLSAGTTFADPPIPPGPPLPGSGTAADPYVISTGKGSTVISPWPDSSEVYYSITTVRTGALRTMTAKPSSGTSNVGALVTASGHPDVTDASTDPLALVNVPTYAGLKTLVKLITGDSKPVVVAWAIAGQLEPVLPGSGTQSDPYVITTTEGRKRITDWTQNPVYFALYPSTGPIALSMASSPATAPTELTTTTILLQRNCELRNIVSSSDAAWLVALDDVYSQFYTDYPDGVVSQNEAGDYTLSVAPKPAYPYVWQNSHRYFLQDSLTEGSYEFEADYVIKPYFVPGDPDVSNDAAYVAHYRALSILIGSSQFQTLDPGTGNYFPNGIGSDEAMIGRVEIALSEPSPGFRPQYFGQAFYQRFVPNGLGGQDADNQAFQFSPSFAFGVGTYRIKVSLRDGRFKVWVRGQLVMDVAGGRKDNTYNVPAIPPALGGWAVPDLATADTSVLVTQDGEADITNSGLGGGGVNFLLDAVSIAKPALIEVTSADDVATTIRWHLSGPAPRPGAGIIPARLGF